MPKDSPTTPRFSIQKGQEHAAHSHLKITDALSHKTVEFTVSRPNAQKVMDLFQHETEHGSTIGEAFSQIAKAQQLEAQMQSQEASPNINQPLQAWHFSQPVQGEELACGFFARKGESHEGLTEILMNNGIKFKVSDRNADNIMQLMVYEHLFMHMEHTMVDIHTKASQALAQCETQVKAPTL